MMTEVMVVSHDTSLFTLTLFLFNHPFLRNKTDPVSKIGFSPNDGQNRRDARRCGRNKVGMTSETGVTNAVQQFNLTAEHNRICKESARKAENNDK